MTVTDVSTGHQYAVRARHKSLQQEAMIYSSGTHEADQSHICGILQTGNPGEIVSGIGTQVRDNGHYPWLIRRRHTIFLYEKF